MDVKEFVSKLPEELKEELRSALISDEQVNTHKITCPKCGKCNYTVNNRSECIPSYVPTFTGDSSYVYNFAVKAHTVEYCVCNTCGASFTITY